MTPRLPTGETPFYPLSLSRTAANPKPRETSAYYLRNPQRSGKPYKGKPTKKHKGSDICNDREPGDELVPGRYSRNKKYFTPNDARLVAVADGFVSYVGPGKIWLNLGGKLYAGYGHVEKSYVKKGEPVYAGQIIGEPGSYGSSWVHLHFVTKRRIGKRKYAYLDPISMLEGARYQYPDSKLEPSAERPPIEKPKKRKGGSPWPLILLLLWLSEK